MTNHYPSTTLRLFAVVLLINSWTLHASDWVAIAQKVDRSTYRLSYPLPDTPQGDTYLDETTYVCTGFSINQPRGYVLTAEHCLGERLTADDQITMVVWKDAGVDLAVLAITGQHKPALHPAKDDAVMGQPLMAFGYGYGEHRPLLRAGLVSNPEMFITGMNSLWLVFSGGVIGGMSGGAMVNTDGQVESIVLMSQDATNTGFGRTMSTIWSVTSQYWQYTR